jgi:acetyltransferase
MSTYRFDRLFAPHSIAIVGASPREHSLGRTILRNVIGGGFSSVFPSPKIPTTATSP